MKSNRQSSIVTKALLAGALFVGSSHFAFANFIGSSSGVFANPVGPAGMVTTGVNTSFFTWGDGLPPPSSSLSFSGASFSVPAETTFSVGTLTYFNGTISLGTEATNVDLLLTLAFTNPSGLTENFSYTLGLINSPNVVGDDIGSADYVTLPSLSSTVFTSGGIDYTLHLEFGAFSGASFGGPNEFRVLEGQTAAVGINGRITTNLNGVPDGGATLALLGLALLPLAVIGRRRVRN